MEAVPEGDWFCAVCLAQVSFCSLIPTPKQKSEIFFLILLTAYPTNTSFPTPQSVGKIFQLGARRPWVPEFSSSFGQVA